MEPSSPHSSFNSHEYFIQPDFIYGSPTYHTIDNVVHVDSLHNPDLPRLNFGNLNSLQLTSTGNGMPHFTSANTQTTMSGAGTYHPPSYVSSMTGRDASPMHSISPPLTSLSASDLSGTEPSALPPAYTHSHHSGTSSPASSSHGDRRDRDSGNGLVHRHHGRALRQSTTSSTVAASGGVTKRKATRTRSAPVHHDDDFDSDEDDAPLPSSEVVVTKRREEVRRQRIESEQRRRDELRDGYRRLKDVLPVSNQKSSKVSLLDRATTHIRQLEMTQTHMIMKINELEAETARLRNVNETLMLSAAAEQRRASASNGF
jgi:hypothetical protein